MRLGATPLSSLAITLSRSHLRSGWSPAWSQAWVTFLALAAVLHVFVFLIWTVHFPFPNKEIQYLGTTRKHSQGFSNQPLLFRALLTLLYWPNMMKTYGECVSYWSAPTAISTLFCFTAFSTMTRALSSTSLVAPGARVLSARPGIGDSISLDLDTDLLVCFPVVGKSSVICAELWS